MKRLLTGILAIGLLIGLSGCSGKSAEDEGKEFAAKIQNLGTEGKLRYIMKKPFDKYMKSGNLGDYIDGIIDGYSENGVDVIHTIKVLQKQDKIDTRFKEIVVATGILAKIGDERTMKAVLATVQNINAGKRDLSDAIWKHNEKLYKQIIDCKYGEYFNLNK